jgi:hypothetical protein
MVKNTLFQSKMTRWKDENIGKQLELEALQQEVEGEGVDLW